MSDPSPDDMRLPVGATCGDCVHIQRCKAIFGHVESDIRCDWSPSRFLRSVQDTTPMNTFRFPIGTKYMERINDSPKYTRVSTVVDHRTTTNSEGEIAPRYVTEHAVWGHVVQDTDVCETTIARGLLPEYFHLFND